MKLGKDINNKYQEGLNVINQAKATKKAIDEDRWLDPKTKQSRQEVTNEKAAEQIKAIRNQILDDSGSTLSTADSRFKRSIKADNKSMAEIGSIMGPLLATMDNNELLTLYENKFDNKAERCLIESYISARVDSKTQTNDPSKLEGVADPVKTKLNEIFNRNIHRLTQDEQYNHNELNLEYEKSKFAVNAAEALRLELHDLKGELAPQSIDMVNRRDAINSVNAYCGNGEPFGD